MQQLDFPKIILHGRGEILFPINSRYEEVVKKCVISLNISLIITAINRSGHLKSIQIKPSKLDQTILLIISDLYCVILIVLWCIHMELINQV